MQTSLALAHPRTAILVTAHGSPAELSELPAFLQRIRRGRPAPPELLAELRHRYTAIGGTSPLLEVTRAQAAGLEARVGLPVEVAMRLSAPEFEPTLASLAQRGFERVLSLPIAPYSVHVYHEALRQARDRAAPALQLLEAPPWNAEPALLRGLADTARELLAARPTEGTELLFTAHSLPLRVVRGGDPYAELVAETARRVGEALASGVPSRLVWQSKGASNEEWLGPDLVEAMEDAKSRGTQRLAVVPLGFLARHIEVLYDLDLEASEQARARGLELKRARVLDADDALLDALESVARKTLAEGA